MASRFEYFSNWRQYEPYREIPIKTSDSAFENLMTKGVSVGMNPNESEVSIDNVYLTYETKSRCL